MEGTNCTLLAYGHTGAGKTYTVSGEQEGIIASSVKEILLRKGPFKFSLTEIYNETLTDLISGQ